MFGTAPEMAAVAQCLREIPGSRHVVHMGDGQAGSLVTADLLDDAVDKAVEEVNRLGVDSEDVVLARVESIGPSVAQRPLASVVWSDLVSQAGANARPFPRYLVFMAIAIIAETSKAEGALLVLGVNVAMLLAGGCLTLVLQRWLARAESRQAPITTPPSG